MKLRARLIAESAVSFELLPVPESNVRMGLQELRTLEIEPPSEGAWTLCIDDEPLPCVEARWRWTPGFHAGEVTAELHDAEGHGVARYLIDVSPDPDKLGRERFARMVEEISAEDPDLLLGEERSTFLTGSSNSPSSRLSLLIALARVRANVPRFLTALHLAAAHPRMTTRRTRKAVPPHRVRRMDAQSLLRWARSPEYAAHSRDAHLEDDQDVRGGPGNGQSLLDVPHAEPHADGAANRAMVALVHVLRQRVRLLLRELPGLVRSGEERSAARSGMGGRLPGWMTLLERFEEALTFALRQEPWRAVTRPELSAAGLNALSADPAYARAWQMAWRALRLGTGDGAEDRLWMSPTWEVFERWCFVRLGCGLRDLLPGFEWARHGTGTHPSSADAAWVGVDAESGMRISLLLQPRFASWDQEGRWGFKSLSRTRIPDLVVAWETRVGRGFVVLDAKYRQARENVLEAMESAHIYRDSLRWHGLPPEYAVLLIPAKTPAAWLSRAEFQQEHRVGAVPMTDGLPDVLLEALIVAGLIPPAARGLATDAVRAV